MKLQPPGSALTARVWAASIALTQPMGTAACAAGGGLARERINQPY